MTWFHGTTNKRFRRGNVIVPATRSGCWSNYSMFEDNRRRELASGRVVDSGEVVWITSDVEEARSWAEQSTLKALPHEIRQMPAGGIAVYEVEPVELDVPLDQHSRTDSEACCRKARVVREVIYDAFPQDLCDDCGDDATVALGSDHQLCAACAAEKEEQHDRVSA